MIRRLICFCAVLFLSVSTAHAEGKKRWGFNISADVFSRHISSATGTPLYKGLSLQTSYTVSYQPRGGCDAVYGNMWQQFGAKRGLVYRAETASETDLTIGCAFTFKEFEFDLSGSYYIIPNSKDSGAITLSIGRRFKFSKTVDIKPYVTISPQFSFGPLENGLHTYLGVEANWRPEKWVTIRIRPYIVYDDGAYGAEPGVIGHVQAFARWKINENVAVRAPHIRCAKPLTHFKQRRPAVCAFGAGIRFTF